MERKELFGLTAFVVSIGLYSFLLVLGEETHHGSKTFHMCEEFSSFLKNCYREGER